MCTDTTSRAPDRGTDEIPNASPTPRICSESNGLADSGSTFLLVVTTWASPGPAPAAFQKPSAAFLVVLALQLESFVLPLLLPGFRTPLTAARVAANASRPCARDPASCA